MPTNYPDLNTMYNNGMSGLASFYGGGREALASQQDQADLQAKRLANQQSAVMNPLNAQFKQGEISAQAASLPGLAGISQSQVAKGQVDTDTAASQIAEKISANSTNISSNDVTQMHNISEKLGMVTQAVEAAGIQDPQAQAAALTKGINASGIPQGADNPLLAPILQNNPTGALDSFKAMQKGMAMASAKFMQETALEDQKGKVQTAIHAANNQTSRDVEKARAAAGIQEAGIHAGATVQAANIHAQTMKEMANSRSQTLMSKMSSDQRIAYLSSIPSSDRTEAEQEALIQLSKQRLAERAAGAPSVPAQMTGMQTPMQTATQSSPFQQQGGAPQAPVRKESVSASGKPIIYNEATGKWEYK